MKLLRTLALLAASSIALVAAPITWTFNGASTLGTNISGSFVYDATTNVFSSVNVITSGGSAGIPARTWTTLASCCTTFGTIPFLGLVDTSNADQTGANILGFYFLTPLTNAGGTINLSGTQQGICSGSICASFTPHAGQPASNNNVFGNITSSSVNTVPEPSSSALALAGLALGAIFRLRSRARS